MHKTLPPLPVLDCTGCSACASICQSNAISMCENNEGFLYPFINKDLCIKCQQCARICPALTPVSKHPLKEGKHFIAQYTDSYTRQKSASGGAFAGIATDVILNRQGVVFGASLCKDLVVRHIMIDKCELITRLQNSKYVQSDINDSYKIAKEQLDANRLVFFTGTPCQIAGLYSYLGKEYKNLLTADIICHGVPSPRLWKRYCAECSRSWMGKVESARFRYKNPFFKSGSSFYMVMRMSKGPVVVRKAVNDFYFNTFLKGFVFREACYRCTYASIERIGDFTLGDCDSRKDYPEFHPNESNSTLMINTHKAYLLWKEGLENAFDYKELDIRGEAKHNKQLNAPFPRPDCRSNIYSDLDSMEWNDFIKQYYTKTGILSRLVLLIACYAPPALIRVLIKLKNILHHL